MKRLSMLAVAAALLAPPLGSAASGLRPGPWVVFAHGHGTNGAPFQVNGTWTASDAGATGPVQPPNPKRMAFTVVAGPKQRVTVAWTTFCFPNQVAVIRSGTAAGQGSFATYPALGAQARRVYCTLMVKVRPAKPGLVKVTFYAY